MSVKGSQKFNITKEELNKLYIVEGLSSFKISEIYGVQDRTIRNYVRKYNLSRTQSEALMMHHNGIVAQPNISEYEKEILIGELLGDGSLKMDCKGSLPYYRHSSKYSSYLEWLASVLPSFKWSEISTTTHKTLSKKNGEFVISYGVRSQCHPGLAELQKMFYDENNMKHIPSDLKITPTILRHWFLGDGTAGYFSTGIRKGKQRTSWQMTIYACAYSRKELEGIIIPQLESLNIKCSVTMKPGRHRMRISSESFDTFYQYIGKCPVECYKYKWK